MAGFRIAKDLSHINLRGFQSGVPLICFANSWSVANNIWISSSDYPVEKNPISGKVGWCSIGFKQTSS